MDREPFIITNIGADNKNPEIASDPEGNVLVVLQNTENDIVSILMHPDEVPNGARRILSGSGDESIKSKPQVIFDGENFFVIWENDLNGEKDIHGRRVSTAGG